MAIEAPSHNQWWGVWDQFKTHRGALAGATVLSLIVIGVIFGPYVWRLSPAYIDFTAMNTGPSWTHPFGTDQLGRDLLARMMTGGRISIAVGFTAMIISIFIGTLVGVLAGYFKSLDGSLMRLTDLFLSLPVLPLLLVAVMLFRDTMASIFGSYLGIFILIVSATGVTSWMQAARIIRGEVLAVKQREFVLASYSIGTPPRRIILRHVLPNVMSPIIVSATLGVATAIISESVLSFLGMGFPPDVPTWGRLLYDGIDQIQGYPQLVLWPGIAISLTVLSVNYIGDGLRDALDPRLRP
ncbi:ABC transporter permease [Mesorhizobium sp. M4A.F.Ca.ET.022.05.2.1]|uniref:ABC transporter permease n=1 Tax=Mesorhizobium sp. M4A.F.Ca.ET.022.05.2.1 TaxID=2496653 RepID=UPI000FCB3765|nr:ABC transporter permease [Mesorhizobium sp. M4A.F.Ca.ET.022.05.2.1]RVC72317.1 ABC transporter permease [Mesorhizobium sp. M2A.F.Ca.ET.046.02.1.1]TIU42922.1 MAG: ABC transporter permease subunit [Mesorhizobium sp.]RVC82545.1 ABC transporter permease [Mesorhizobium sp. M4A.F.Ca.ET.022.05.2.1]TIW60147.1 MAG: ABC transporter permease subunit [Mesorhizobium sp.]TJW31082.1 MAG: ABC transporter permease subunit [Mesorhizobium sp.]